MNVQEPQLLPANSGTGNLLASHGRQTDPANMYRPRTSQTARTLRSLSLFRVGCTATVLLGWIRVISAAPRKALRGHAGLVGFGVFENQGWCFVYLGPGKVEEVNPSRCHLLHRSRLGFAVFWAFGATRKPSCLRQPHKCAASCSLQPSTSL